MYSMKKKDEDEDVKYHAQICLTDSCCNIVKNNRKINPILEPKKVNPIFESKPKSKSKPKAKLNIKIE